MGLVKSAVGVGVEGGKEREVGGVGVVESVGWKERVPGEKKGILNGRVH